MWVPVLICSSKAHTQISQGTISARFCMSNFCDQNCVGSACVGPHQAPIRSVELHESKNKRI